MGKRILPIKCNTGIWKTVNKDAGIETIALSQTKKFLKTKSV